MFRLFNLAWFQSIFWLSLAYQHQFLWLTVLIMLLHFMVVRGNLVDVKTACLGLFCGLLIDASLTQLGVFSFTITYGLPMPLWLCVMWMAFACTLNYSLRLFRNKYLWGGLAAVVFGPLSYWTGYRLGAVSFPFGLVETLLIVSVKWAIAFPLLSYIISHFIDKPLVEKSFAQ